MKNKILARCTSLLLILGACQSGSKSDKEQGNVTDQVSGVENEPLQFHLVKAARERDTIPFEIKKPSWVSIVLSTPSDTANIRINQIIMPDGGTDGPFGRTYEDSLRTPGIYQLIIAESMMQGNSYRGEYHVEIDIKD